MDNPLRKGFQVGEWVVSPLEGRIARNEESIHLEPKVMDVLVCLASNAGEVTGRDALLNEVWGASVVSDEPLTRCIAALRKVLGDDPQKPQYIQTVPKRGYRLIADVSSDDVSSEIDDSAKPNQTRRLGFSVGLLALVLVIGLYVWVSIDSRDGPSLGVETSVVDRGATRSIVILPVRVKGAAAVDTSFVDTMHFDLSGKLSKLSLFDKVISSASADPYRDTDKPPSQVGEELDVNTIVDTIAQVHGESVLIRVQLVDVSNGAIIWTGEFERELSNENLFELPGEISQEIVAELHGDLSKDDAENLRRVPTESLEAWGEYTLGRKAMIERTADALNEAKAHFERAIELDAEFALAYVGIADVATELRWYSDQMRADTYSDRKDSLDRALEIDPSLGEAHALLGRLHETEWERSGEERRRKKADEHYRKAIELDPNSARAHELYANFLNWNRRSDEALELRLRAIELNPADPMSRANLGWDYILLGRLADAEHVLMEGVEQHPDFEQFHANLGLLYRQQGLLGRSAYWFREARKLNPGAKLRHVEECDAYIFLGHERAAEECLAALYRAFPLTRNRHAMLYEALYRPDEAIEVIEKLPDRSKDFMSLKYTAELYLEAGRIDRAESLILQIAPDLLEDPNFVVKKDDIDLQLALNAAYIFHTSGNDDRANYLLDQVLEIVRSDPEPRPSIAVGILANAMRGNRQAAVDGLRRALHGGWRFGWWIVGQRYFDIMNTEPEWIALREELFAEIEGQRQWFDEHVDKPLM